jgi:acyl-CoA thioesterase-1
MKRFSRLTLRISAQLPPQTLQKSAIINQQSTFPVSPAVPPPKPQIAELPLLIVEVTPAPTTFGEAAMKTIALLCLAVLASAALAQAPKAPVKKERKPNPAMANIEDVPGLPRVLIIGDSISIGYTLDVRELLKGKANVHRIPTNGGPTTNGLKNIQAWLGDSKWDVIHFNWGLHDLKYIQDDPSKRADPKASGSHLQVALLDYEKNLAALVKTMQATGAKLIWCATTPVPAGSDGRIESDEVKYNEAAARVMTAAGIPTNDLRAHALAKPEAQLPANVHYSPEGSRYLAEKVAAMIAEHLPKK